MNDEDVQQWINSLLHHCWGLLVINKHPLFDKRA